MQKNFEAAFFDFDGTIADTGEGIFESAQFALASMGYPPATPEQLRAFIGPPIFDSFKSISGGNDEICNELSRLYRLHYSEGGILLFRVYDGILGLFGEIKESGMKLAIVSSKPERFIRRIVAHLGEEELFDCIACPLDDNHPESKSELMERACRTLSLESSEAVMVGDRRFDMEGAGKAGIKSIGVLYGYGSREELVSAGADYVAANAEEIKKLLFTK